MNIAYLLPGLTIAAIGFVVLFALLASQNALAKSKQLDAVGRMASGRAAPGTSRWLVVAASLIGFGACTAFVGVGMSDRERADACIATCKAKGYTKAKIRASTVRDHEPARPKAAAFVACACEGGPPPDPLELRADDLAR